MSELNNWGNKFMMRKFFFWVVFVKEFILLSFVALNFVVIFET